MPKLYSSAHIVKVPEKHGFSVVSQKGSHRKMKRKGNPSLMTIVPANKKEVPSGTFHAILRQSNLQEVDFQWLNVIGIFSILRTFLQSFCEAKKDIFW